MRCIDCEYYDDYICTLLRAIVDDPEEVFDVCGILEAKQKPKK